MILDKEIYYEICQAYKGLKLFNSVFEKEINRNERIILLLEYNPKYLEIINNNRDLLYFLNGCVPVCIGFNEKYGYDKRIVQSDEWNAKMLTIKETEELIALSNLYPFYSNISIVAFEGVSYRKCYGDIDDYEKILYGVMNITPYIKRCISYKIGTKIYFTQKRNSEYLTLGFCPPEKFGSWTGDSSGFYFEFEDFDFSEDLVCTIKFSRIIDFYQEMIIYINGYLTGKLNIFSSLAHFKIPKECIQDGKILLVFQWPKATLIPGDSRLLSVMFKSMVIEYSDTIRDEQKRIEKQRDFYINTT